MKLSVEITEFKAICKGTLRGFAVIAIPELKMKIREVGLFEKNTSRWASLPSRPQIGRDGNLRRSGDGRVLYSPLIEITDATTRWAFSAKVVEAALTTAAFDCNTEAAA